MYFVRQKKINENIFDKFMNNEKCNRHRSLNTENMYVLCTHIAGAIRL